MDVNAIGQLRKMHDTSFIFIYHTTKDGKFKGVNEHAHEVDVIVQVDKGKATSTGRFNGGARCQVH
jgi:predicted ATP-dependent serine protease